MACQYHWPSVRLERGGKAKIHTSLFKKSSGKFSSLKSSRNGSIPFCRNISSLSGVVVLPFTAYPFAMKASAKGSPNQPQPKMEIEFKIQSLGFKVGALNF